jgi:hypothetical protein
MLWLDETHLVLVAAAGRCGLESKASSTFVLGVLVLWNLTCFDFR